jgi:hypothetical protein
VYKETISVSPGIEFSYKWYYNELNQVYHNYLVGSFAKPKFIELGCERRKNEATLVDSGAIM